MATRPLTYADAGVDIAAGEKAVELIKEHVRSTFRPEVIGDIGGFGGLFVARPAPATASRCSSSSTDGVGTKSLIARPPAATTRSASTSSRCASTTSLCQGAEPLFFLDYISVGKLVPERDRRRSSPASPRAAARPAAR